MPSGECRTAPRSIVVMSEIKKLFAPTERPFPAENIPQIVFDENPDWVDFYNTAWKIAWGHVYESPAIPVSPYMGEGCATNKVWIWDSCFMTQFCRYAFKVFPGIETMDNFYKIMYDGKDTGIKVHHPDNPPLFAWAEYLYYQQTGDKERLKRIMLKEHYLERHYDWLENLDCAGECPPYGTAMIRWKKEAQGYRWSGCPSGMDNTPRGRDDYDSIYWLDALAQQGLSALYISRLAAIVGDHGCEERFKAEYEEKKKLMQSYWDSENSVFFDRLISGGGFSKVLTPASFWPVLAELADPEQVEAMCALLTDPRKLGGIMPLPSVSRDDPDFAESGDYWRGGVWLPVVYMTVKALEKYGKYELASSVSQKIIAQMFRVYAGYIPHTIWECYRPTSPEPALNGKVDIPYVAKEKTVGKVVRQDFCGWSALAPISLMIENVIGIHDISAERNTICWRVTRNTRHGIRDLYFVNNRVTLIAENGLLDVTAEKAFTLKVNSQIMDCHAGKSLWQLK